MASVALAFDILARDKASKTISHIGDETGKTHGKLAAMAGAFAGGALAKLGTDFFKGGLEDIKAAAQQSAQTAAVIKSTGGAAGVTQTHIEGLADSIEKMSGVAAENVQAGQNMLLTFTNIKGANFDAATRTLTDMSVAMGTDAKSSAIQLGKALNDPIKGVGALSKVGVTFDDAQKKNIASMVKMGDTAGAQKVILSELNKEFGGSAKAAGETMAGKMEILKAKFGDVRQSVVEQMLPALMGLMTFVTTTALPAIQSLGKFLSDNKEVIIPLVAAIGTFAAALKIAGMLMKVQAAINVAFGTSLDIAFGPIALIVVGIAALAAGLIYAYKHSATFRAIVQGTFHAVGAAFSAAWAVIKGGFNWLKDHWKLILSILTGPIGAAVIFIISHWDQIVGVVKKLPGRIASAASGMWDGIKNAFKSAINWIIDGWNGMHFRMPSFDTHIPGVGTVGGFDMGLPHIPRLALGGIVSRPTLVLAGEAGPEAIVPLNRAGGFGQQPPQSIHLYIDGREIRVAQRRTSRLLTGTA